MSSVKDYLTETNINSQRTNQLQEFVQIKKKGETLHFYI